MGQRCEWGYRSHGQTHEEVVCIRAEATNFEELHHIPELTMDVAAYLDQRKDAKVAEGLKSEIAVP